MFNSITGKITAKLPNTLCIENNGIEWKFTVSNLSLDSFGILGKTTRVFSWLYHREDQMRLYGFPTEEDRASFIELITVDGIGPRQGIKILSSISSAELERALENEDVARLTKAPGIGKKTAQKMILSLKGTLVRQKGTAQTAQSSEHEDIVTALTDMGFDRKAATIQVEKVSTELANNESLASKTPSASSTTVLPLTGGELEQEIFRRAIVALSSGRG